MLLTTSGILRINKKELKFLPSGNAVLKMSCVSSEKFKGSDGSDKENTCWIDVVSYSKQAEAINNYFNEKDRIFIAGKLKQESWEKDGQKYSKHILQVESFDFIERKDNAKAKQEPQIVYEDDIDSSEIPF